MGKLLNEFNLKNISYENPERIKVIKTVKILPKYTLTIRTRPLKMMSAQYCPCGSKLNFSECCAKFLEAKTLAKTPEELMRSRYCAFATETWQYLVDTHHPSTRSENLLESLIKNSSNVHWRRLIVLNHNVQSKQPKGNVEFVAFYTQGDAIETPLQIHENSDFILEDGKWYYVKGEFLKPYSLGRNDLCWCGSEKKLKKCHG